VTRFQCNIISMEVPYVSYEFLDSIAQRTLIVILIVAINNNFTWVCLRIDIKYIPMHMLLCHGYISVYMILSSREVSLK
jgi:hypothetical protein